MIFPREIKDFTKNTLILTLLFTLVLHLTWTYLRPYLSLASFAQNDARFEQINATYLGGVATALSLNMGLREKTAQNAPVALSMDTITIGEALSNTQAGQKRLITDNIISISAYLNLLKMDIPSMLDTSIDRAKALDEHISLLKTYYVRTGEKAATLSAQITELKNTITENANAVNASKASITTAYRGLDYDTMEKNLETYMKARQEDVKARTYLTFLEKFGSTYATLQAENGKLLDTLINNREAFIKRASVVLPDSGTELMKKLKLIETEAEFKANQAN